MSAAPRPDTIATDPYPGYRLKDGDAAFLDPGTPIYQVNGHLPSEELATRFSGSFLVYTATAPAP